MHQDNSGGGKLGVAGFLNLGNRIGRRRAVVAAISAIALVDCTRQALHAATQTSTWVGGSSSNWSAVANWSPANTYPNNGNASISDFNVVINAVTTPDVSPILDVPATIDDLALGTGASLTLGSNETMNIGGPTVSNNGVIQIDRLSAAADLNFTADTSISGTGTVMLDDYNPFALLTAAAGVTVTNGANQTIDGVGEIEADLVNNGIVNANFAGQALLLQGDNVTNNNLFESTGSGSFLTIKGITVTQGVSGKLSAAGGTVTVTGGATISGGTINANAGSAVDVTLSGTFVDLTITSGSTVVVAPSSTLSLTGPTITNNGTIIVDQLSGNADLNITSSMTLTGSGKVELLDYNPDARLTAATGATLTNDVNETIDGVGEIDAPLINNGTVNADYASHALLLQTSNMTNNNLFESTGSGSFLTISGITVTQGVSGKISAAGGTVTVTAGAIISGGTISSATGSNVDVTNAGGTFANLTIATGTNVVVAPSSTLNLTGPTVTNNGTITVDQYSGNADLNITGSMTLSGSGTVTLFDNNPNARITGVAGATLTNDVHQTINGIGEIDVPLINNGTVMAQVLVSHNSLFINQPITGTGTLGAGTGALLVLSTGIGGSSQGALSIAATGKLDITNNHLFINYGSGADPIASIAAMIKSGFNGGAWNGTGIESSAAAANSGSYGIGYADSADPGNPAGLSSGQIEIKYTLLGDANLDGAVNGSDFAIMATNFNKAVLAGHSGWDEGDFNYDGSINGSDFAALAANFNKGASQSADAALDSFASANGLMADVPEPASMGIAGIAAVGFLKRRRRE